MRPIPLGKVAAMFRLKGRFALLLVTGAAVVAWLGCVSPRTASAPDQPAVLLHIDYRSGGDSPIGFLMTFREDRTVRLLSPRGTVRVKRMSSADATELRALLQSTEVVAWLDSMRTTGNEFACCDAREAGIYLGEVAPPIAVRLDEPAKLDGGGVRLFEYLNRVRRHYFGGSYRVSLPVR